MQYWPPGPDRCAGWVLHDLGPRGESLVLSRRDGVWIVSHPALGFTPNEEGDGFLPCEPDRDRYPLTWALHRRQFATRYQALGIIATEVEALQAAVPG